MRHGESEANVLKIVSSLIDKYPLTEAGRQQVANSANQLKDLDLDGIVYSPVLRTRQTAEIAAEILGLPCEADERIRETDLQHIEGKPVMEMSASERARFRLEPWESHVKRMRSCISSRSGSYLVVSHAMPIRTLICSYMSIADEDSCKGVEIGYASMSGVICGSSGVISVGSQHLSDEFKSRFRDEE